MAAARFLVSGKVQGVFYRVSTRERALELGLSGRAINLHDGCVEVVAQGDADALDVLEAWLHQGPPSAKVDAVVRQAWEEVVDEGFVTG